MALNTIEYDDDYFRDDFNIFPVYYDEEIRICMVCEKKQAIHMGRYCGGYCEYLNFKKKEKAKIKKVVKKSK
jgi:hypothetical protein